MKKDFKKWHQEKEQIHDEKIRPFFREGEVWSCAVGINVGFEQDGRGNMFLRPVVIVKKFNNDVFWAVPLTRKKKKGVYYFTFKLNKEISVVILSQIRLIDGKRLQYRIGVISEVDLSEIRKRLKQFLT